MKKVTTSLALSIIILFFTQLFSQGIIFLDRTGFYIAGSGSIDWNISNNCSLKIQSIGPNSIIKSGSVSPSTSFNANASIGYYMDQWRIEAEGNYRHNPKNTNFSLDGITVTDFGFVSKFSTMANVYYDIPMTPLCGFYLGAGAGAAYSEIEVIGLINDSVRDTRFAYQLMGGLFYNINRCIAFTLGYRLFGTTSPKETIFYGKNITATVDGEGSPIIQSAELGIRISL